MINPRVDCSQSPPTSVAPEECVALDLAIPSVSDEWIQFAEIVRRAIERSRCSTTSTNAAVGELFAVDPYAT